MSAQIFDLARYQSKKASHNEKVLAGVLGVPAQSGDDNSQNPNITLEQQAVSIINVALADHLDPTALSTSEKHPEENLAAYQAGLGQWTPIGPGTIYHYADDKIYTDTAPCELNPQDPA